MRRLELQAETLLAAGTALGIAAFRHPGFLAGLLLFFFCKKYRFLFLLGMILGAFSWYLHRPSGNAPEHFWPTHDQHLAMTFRLQDTRLGLSGNSAAPFLLRAKVLSPCKGEIDVIFPESEFPPHFGDVCTAQGILKKLEPGKRRLFYAERLLALQPGPWTLWHLPLLLRDKLLARLLHGVRSDAVRQLAPQLFFGAGSGPDRELRQDFIRSGTIHLFSVSGMHVAVLAALLLLLLRPLPFSLRYRLLALGVALYVAATGANAPALRAGFMIVMWSILRSSGFSSTPLRTMMLAGVLLLVFDPQALFQVGFQYSFVITAILLLTAEKLRTIRRIAEAPLSLTSPQDPAGRTARKRFSRNFRLASALLICGIAFLAGAGISAGCQDQLLPGSAATNFLLLPVTPLLFAAMGFKLSFGAFLEQLDVMGVQLLELSFQLLQDIAGFGRACFGPLDAVRPAHWEALLYTLLLFAALNSHSFRRGFICMLGALLLLVSWPLRTVWEKPGVAVISGAAGEPPMVLITDPVHRLARIVHAPDRNSARLGCNCLLQRGFHRAEWYTAGRRSSASRGLAHLASGIDISRLVLPEPDRFDRAFRESLRCSVPESVLALQRENPVPLKIFEKNNTLQLEYSNPGSTLSFDMQMESGDEGRSVILRCRGMEYRHFFAWSNTPEVWSHEFR